MSGVVVSKKKITVTIQTNLLIRPSSPGLGLVVTCIMDSHTYHVRHNLDTSPKYALNGYYNVPIKPAIVFLICLITSGIPDILLSTVCEGEMSSNLKSMRMDR